MLHVMQVVEVTLERNPKTERLRRTLQKAGKIACYM